VLESVLHLTVLEEALLSTPPHPAPSAMCLVLLFAPAVDGALCSIMDAYNAHDSRSETALGRGGVKVNAIEEVTI